MALEIMRSATPIANHVRKDRSSLWFAALWPMAMDA